MLNRRNFLGIAGTTLILPQSIPQKKKPLYQIDAWFHKIARQVS